MSLLLSQVGAPPAPPDPTPAVRLRTTTLPDSGHIEARGVIRLGLVVAAVVVAATPAIRLVPAQLDQPVTPSGRITTGYEVAAPVAAPTIRVVPVALPTTDVQRGIVRPGGPSPIGPPRRITPVALPDVEGASGKIRAGFAVTAPAVVAYRITPATLHLPDPITPPSRHAVGYVVAPPVVADEPGGVRVTVMQRYAQVNVIGGTIP